MTHYKDAMIGVGLGAMVMALVLLTGGGHILVAGIMQ